MQAVADAIATSFRCGNARPDYHGMRGPKAGDAMLFHGERQQRMNGAGRAYLSKKEPPMNRAMNRTLILIAVIAAAHAAPRSVEAAESVYTDTKLDKCENLIPNPGQIEIDMGVASYKCPGYKGYPFYFEEEDVRQSVHFGHLSEKILVGAGETFAVFNHIGDTIEWRLDEKGTPRATILRYTMENQNPRIFELDKAFYGQVLVVSRIGQPDDMTGCVTAYVDALENKDADRLARRLADEQAPNFPCGRQKPVFHGRKGDKSSEPVYNYPEAKAD